MDEQAKRLVCRMIAGLVASDEDFDDSERAFLDKMLARFGIPEDEWDAIFPLLEHDEAEAAIRSLDAAGQEETLKLLILAAEADGVVAPEERTYLDIVGRAMGLTEAEVSSRLGAAAHG